MASKNRGGKKSSPLGSSSHNSIDQGELLKKAIQRVVCEPIFKDFKKHGNSTWNPCSIAILAILTAWMPSPQLTERNELHRNKLPSGFEAITTQVSSRRIRLCIGAT
jgi:hypothetical protein